jgi:cytochrome bd-type quinol oxidase subunit 2
MNQDAEHLRLLSIFHYIVAGLAALFACFPLLYTTVGTVFIFVARHQTSAEPKPAEGTPPEFIGWIFAVIGSFLFLVGIAIAICILIAGRSLAKHTLYWFAFVMACIECLFIPFGTILGVFTIIVLSRESVKALFPTADPQKPTI